MTTTRIGMFRTLDKAYRQAVVIGDERAITGIKDLYRTISGGCEPDSHSWHSGSFCHCGREEWRYRDLRTP